MTTALASTPELRALTAPAPSQELRRFTTDTLISANRQNTPQAAVDQRKVPRLSIAELNEMDVDSIRDALNRSRPDSRTAVEKFIDLIDLPRNALFNLGAAIVAPNLRREASERGDIGAFGIPRVMGSDVLDAAGVDNRIVKGVLGFVGDVALDPLTYLGPAGWGVKAGKTAISAGGKRALQRGIKQARRGGIESVDIPEVRDVFRSIAAEAGEDFAARSTDEQIRLLSERAFGAVTRREGGDRFERALRVIGADELRGGSIISEGLEKLARVSGEGADLAGNAADRLAAEASGRFIERFGKVGQGIRLGPNAGSTIAHIPFTGIGIHVHAFTGTGAEAALDRAMALARTGRTNSAGVYLQNVGHIENATRATQEVIDIANELSRASDPNVQDGLREAMRTVVGDVTEASGRVASFAGDNPERFTAFAEAGDMGDVLFLGQLTRAAKSARRRATSLQNVSGIQEAMSQRGARLDMFARLGADDGLVAADDIAPLDFREAAMNDAQRSFMDGLNELERTVLALSDEDAEFMEIAANAFSEAVTAAQNLAGATHSNLVRGLTNGEWMMVKLAQRLTNTGSADAGSSLLQNMADVTRRLGGGDDGAVAGFLESADRNVRGVFGRRSGMTNEARARFMQEFQQGSRDVGLAKGRQIADEVAVVMDDAGMKDVSLDETLSVLTALATRAADPQDRNYWRHAFNPDPAVREDAPFLRKIAEAQAKGGILSDPVVAQRLTEIADREALFFQNVGKLAIEDQLLSRLLPGYIPVRLKDEAAQKLRERGRLGRVPPGAVGAIGGAQDFQKSRSTLEYRFEVQPDEGLILELSGQHRQMLMDSGLDRGTATALARESAEDFLAEGTRLEQVFQSDIDLYRNMSFKEIRELALSSPEDAQLALAAKLRVRELERAAERTLGDGVNLDEHSDAIRAQFARPADPVTLAEMAETARFSYLKGDIIEPGDLFETNLATLAMRRTAAHARAAAQRGFIENIVEPNALLIPGGKKNSPGGRSAITAKSDGQRVVVNGIAGVVRESKKAPNGVMLRVGPVNYRFIDKDAMADSLVPLIDEVTGGQHLDALYPEHIAEAVERFAAAFRPESTPALLDAAEDITRFWKQTTLLHPSWVAVNAVGNTVLAAMGGVNLARWSARMKDAFRIVRGRTNPAALEGKTINIRGVDVPMSDIAAEVGESGAANASRTYFNEMEAYRRGMIEPDLRTAIRDGARRAGGPKQSAGRRIKDSWLNGVSDTLRAAKEVRGPRSAGALVNDAMSRTIIQPWFRGNAFMEDTQRVAAYLSFLDEGFDAAAAGEKTVRTFFDYSDFTVTEQKIRRYLIPFYSWIRNNAPYQIEQLFRNPKFAASVPRVRDAMEQALNGEANIPQNQRPRFIRDQISLQIGSDPESRYGLLLSNMLPTQEAILAGATISRIGGGDLGEAGQLFLKGLVSSFSPTIKTPVEIGIGREAFTGREVGPDKLSGDLSAGELVAGQFRPFREFGVGSAREGPLQRSFGEGVGQGIGRLLLGGRIQSLDESRIRSQLLRDFTGRERGIRRAIAIANREGREGTSLDARTELMKLYREMVQAGLGDEVPKWAIQQLTPAPVE